MSLLNPQFEDPSYRKSLKEQFSVAQPFSHIAIDNFLEPRIAETLAEEFPNFHSNDWYHYENSIENKKALNSWDRFGAQTYRVFFQLNQQPFSDLLSEITGVEGLHGDIGLHGGGLHSHGSGGNLNVHLDYAIHPKLKMERRLNLIIYLTPNWDERWGGSLELWSHNSETNLPKERIKSICPNFNRAVIFDTTQNSWHGLPNPIDCPPGIFRQSVAIYYLTPTEPTRTERPKALFAPRKEQVNDSEVLNLIKDRAKL